MTSSAMVNGSPNRRPSGSLVDHLQLSIPCRLHENLMVALALIRIGNREAGNGLVELIAVAEISGE
jgi:hypothetical protein